MLELLRKGVKTWVAKALLGLLILSFAVWGIGGEIFSFSFRTAVARAGDTKVTAERFVNAYTQEQNRLSQQRGEAVSHSVMRDLGIDQRVLQRLLREAAFNEELTSMGVRIGDEAAYDAIRQQPEFQNEDGSLSIRAVQYTLGQLGITEAEFIDLNRNLVGQNLLTGPAVAPTRSPPGFAARMAAFQTETKRIASISFELEEAANPGAPNDSQIAEFYEANKDRYVEPERRWGEFIHVDFEALVAASQPSEDVIAQTYEAERQAYEIPATRTIDQMPFPDLAMAEAALARLRSGEIDFEGLAAEEGHDMANLDLGVVGREDVPPATADAIFSATEPGILDAIDLPIGAAIVRVRSVTEGGEIPLEQVRTALADRLAREEAYSKAPTIANQLDDLRASGTSMADTAAQVGLPLGKIEGFGADGSLPHGAPAGPPEVLLRSEARREVLDALDGEERSIIELQDGGFLLVHIERIEEGGQQEMGDVIERVVADWTRAQRLADLTVRAEKTAALATDGTLAAIALALGKELATPDPFTRADAPVDLSREALDRVFTSETGTALVNVTPDETIVQVIEVTASVDLPPEITVETAEQLDIVLEQSIRLDEAELLSRAIVASHETGTDPAALDEVFTYLGGQNRGGY
ncbi:MAG: SurA N-terminal domain-containing protein [Pseudomonadota bacterium]